MLYFECFQVKMCSMQQEITHIWSSLRRWWRPLPARWKRGTCKHPRPRPGRGSCQVRRIQSHVSSWYENLQLNDNQYELKYSEIVCGNEYEPKVIVKYKIKQYCLIIQQLWIIKGKEK